ncbi:hypothetical protein MKX03_017381 [Papaver bracteatum]|nr:hypothetical protein MKX03_017381 [Papaver bracteatum]
MANIANFLCVFSLVFLALSTTSSAYYGNEEPTPTQESLLKVNVGVAEPAYKTSHYLPKLPEVKPYVPAAPKPYVPAAPKPAYPQVPYVPAAPKPYVPAAPKPAYPQVPSVPAAPKPYVPAAPKPAYPQVPYVPTVPKVKNPYVPSPPKNYAVQGLVYCQFGAERTPIKGVVTKVVCFAADLVSQLLTITSTTDAHGYFYTPLDVSSIIYQVFQCKVYLDTCPMTTCSKPTNINNGVSGALLSINYQSLPNNKNLLSVGPFFYTPETKY